MISLRVRLTLALVAVALSSVALVGLLSYRSARDSITQLATQLVGVVASDRRAAFTQRLQRQQSRMETFVRAAEPCVAAPVRRRECEHDLRLLAAAESFSRVVITDSTGDSVLVSSSPVPPPRIAWTAGGRVPPLAEFRWTERGPVYYLRRHLPAPPGSAADRSRRWLFAEVDARSLRDFGPSPQLGIHGETFLADPTGRAITPLLHDMPAGPAAAITAPPMRVCLGGVSGEMIAPGYDGVQIIHGFRHLPEIGGGCIMAHMSRAEAFQPIAALRRRLLVTAIVLAALSALLSALLAGSLVRPLQRLSERVDAFGRTSSVSEEASSSVTEIRLLARAFDAMARAVRRRTADLEQALATRARFYNAMNHELRTPVNAILGYNDLLTQGVFGPLTDAQRSAVARSQRATRHLRELVDDVLDLARIEAGKVEVRREEVRARELLDDLVATLTPAAADRGCSIETLCEPPDAVVVTDPRRVRQILLNLLSNALKFGAGGAVQLRCARTEDGVVFDVADRGPGIAPDEWERVFEEYVRLHGESEVGTGLGLPIARRLAVALGGSLRVLDSTPRGTTFRLTLPP